MLSTKKPFTLALTCLALVLPSLGVAATDDNIIWKSAITNARVWNLKAGDLYIGAAESISDKDDKDYIVLMCRGGNVNRAGISYLAKSGDLDIKVYDVGGKYLGSSATKGSTDSVDVSSKNLKAVVIEVYGYNGATNTYNPDFSCQSTASAVTAAGSALAAGAAAASSSSAAASAGSGSAAAAARASVGAVAARATP